MKNTFIYIFYLLIYGCGTVKVQNYNVESGAVLASVEVDGIPICETTPCDVPLTSDYKFVGLAYSPDGYECQGEHHISVFPKTSSVNPPYAKTVTVQTCLNTDTSRTISFDLNIKPTEPAVSGQFLKKIKIIKYAALGVQNNRWHSKKNSENDSRASDFFISYGQEIFKSPGNLLLGELIFGKQTPLSTEQYQIGAAIHGYYTPLYMFYLSGGLFYKKIENEFASDGIFPYAGLGLLLNSVTVVEFWNIFKGPFAKREDFTYQLGSIRYDFFLESGIYLHNKLNEWDSQNLNAGIRVYY